MDSWQYMVGEVFAVKSQRFTFCLVMREEATAPHYPLFTHHYPLTTNNSTEPFDGLAS